MGLFKRQPKKSWVDEVEDFANFAGELRYATDQIINAAADGNDWLVQQIWDNMTTQQRQYGFWFMLGMVAEMIAEERYYEEG